MGLVSHPVRLDTLVENYNLKNFVETGTGDGSSMDIVTQSGLFDNLYGVELDEDWCEKAVKRFPNAKMYQGYTKDEMYKVLDDLDDKPTLFWLDAHENNSPYKMEIEAILKHPKKNHTIIVDDIEVYYIDVDWIKNKLLEYNPSYKFKIYEKKSLVCTA